MSGRYDSSSASLDCEFAGHVMDRMGEDAQEKHTSLRWSLYMFPNADIPKYTLKPRGDMRK